MAVTIFTGLNPDTLEPLDSRTVAANEAERFGLPVTIIYDGLVVYQEDDQKLYVLTDTDNVGTSAGWTEVGSGGGGSVTPENVTQALVDATSIAIADQTTIKANLDVTDLTQGNIELAITDDDAFRTSIGAGTSSFSGSYPDLSNIPTNIAVTNTDNSFSANQSISRPFATRLTLNNSNNSVVGSLGVVDFDRNESNKGRLLGSVDSDGDGVLDLDTTIGTDLNQTAIKINSDGVNLPITADGTAGVVGISATGLLSRVAGGGGDSNVPEPPARNATNSIAYVLNVPSVADGGDIDWLSGVEMQSYSGITIDGGAQLTERDIINFSNEFTGSDDATNLVSDIGLATTLPGNRTFTLPYGDSGVFSVQNSSNNDLFRVTNSNVEINNSADVVIHQGDITQEVDYDGYQRVQYNDGEGINIATTGHLSAVDLRLFSRYQTTSSLFPQTRMVAHSVGPAYNTSNSALWDTTNPNFTLASTANWNGADRSIAELRVESKGDGTDIDGRFRLLLSTGTSLVEALTVDGSAFRATLPVISSNYIRPANLTQPEIDVIDTTVSNIVYNVTDNELQISNGTSYVSIGGSDVPNTPARFPNDTVQYILNVPSTTDGSDIDWIDGSNTYDNFKADGVLNSIVDLTLTDTAAITAPRNLGGELLHQGRQTGTGTEEVVYGRIVSRVTPGTNGNSDGTSSYDFYVSDDGQIATTLGLRIGHESSFFGDGGFVSGPASARTAHLFDTDRFVLTDVNRYNTGATIDTVYKDNITGNIAEKSPLFDTLFISSYMNNNDTPTNAGSLVDLIDYRTEYESDDDDAFGTFIVSPKKVGRGTGASATWDTFKVTPGKIEVFGNSNNNTDGIVISNTEVGNSWNLTFSEIIVSGTTDAIVGEGFTSGTTDTTERPYTVYYYLDSNTYYRVEGVASDFVTPGADNPWWHSTIDGGGLDPDIDVYYTEQIWNTTQNDANNRIIAKRL